MGTCRINVDGEDIEAEAGRSLLEVLRENGKEIPTLCYDEHLSVVGTCGMCVVEMVGFGLVSSCSTNVGDAMEIMTRSEAVFNARKSRLEEILRHHHGDCYPPCTEACPGNVDIRGYVAMIARGAYRETYDIVKESVPLPGTIGRVCPHPCEEVCRRNAVDEPVSICALKRFATDRTLEHGDRMNPEPAPPTGKKLAIVGSGPAGLSAAYYLALLGHSVMIYEAQPDTGGMLRYGIPDYRLPQDVLDAEIDIIKELGVAIETNTALGRDFTVESLFSDGYDAIFLGIGAWSSYSLRAEGEDLEGVWQGIDFLREVTLGNPPDFSGKKVVVIGGGNTAIDASRTALRLDAERVDILYRRSRIEMPASDWEIEEALEEGVGLEFLTAPSRVIGEGGKVCRIEMIRMVLGEPDDSGRRRPVPVEGSEYELDADVVIPAIGQAVDLSCLPGDHDFKLEWRKLWVNPTTFMTSVKGVFSGGDCVTGAATAIEAIGAGKKAAVSMDHYLREGASPDTEELATFTRGDWKDLDRSEFSYVVCDARAQKPTRPPEERKNDFYEFEGGLAEEEAIREALRCLECGCGQVQDCVLRRLATEYGVPVEPDVETIRPIDRTHPVILRDPNKCINCTLCVRTCREIQGIGAISTTYRVERFADICEGCGHCEAICPTGALVSRKALTPKREVKTTCPYCGCGCELILGVRGGQIVRVRGDPGSPANHGRLCVKGRYGYDFVNHPGRLRTPLIKRNGRFEEATWDEALDLVVSRLSEYHGDEFAGVSSAKVTNEENYLIQKFTRAVMGTNNTDHCARLCHAPTVTGLVQSLGSGAMTNSIDEVEGAKCIFAIGTNTTTAHPIIGLLIKKAVGNGSKLIVANPKRIDLCRFADIHLQFRPGTDVPLMMGMMRVMVEEGLVDEEFIGEKCCNYDEFKRSLEAFDLDWVEEVTWVPREKIEAAARIYATTKPGSILYSMGITQHSHGTDNVLATSNLALLTGNLGKPSTGVNPLRGQNNVQGACDLGALPNVYPGYQKVVDPAVKAKFETAWGAELSGEVGLAVTEMPDAILNGSLKAMYLVGENPFISEADSNHVREAFDRLEFLVVQDIFLTETAQAAHVVLPAAGFAEKDGTFTNTERRIQRVRKAIDPVGDSRPDWWITCEIARRLGGGGFDFNDPEEVQEEIASLSPIYGGIHYDRIEKEGLQWPCPNADHPGTKFLYPERFSTPDGKGRLIPLKYRPSAELPDDEYPLILTTDRSLYHFHTATMTRKSPELKAFMGHELMLINPADAERFGISDGEEVNVLSRRGKVSVHASINDICPPGVVSMTFHFAESPTNALTNAVLDPVAKIPETKVCAVRVEKVD